MPRCGRSESGVQRLPRNRRLRWAPTPRNDVRSAALKLDVRWAPRGAGTLFVLPLPVSAGCNGLSNGSLFGRRGVEISEPVFLARHSRSHYTRAEDHRAASHFRLTVSRCERGGLVGEGAEQFDSLTPSSRVFAQRNTSEDRGSKSLRHNWITVLRLPESDWAPPVSGTVGQNKLTAGIHTGLIIYLETGNQFWTWSRVVITGDSLRHLILITHRLLKGEVWIFWASIHPVINRTATFQRSFSSVGASGSKSQRWFSAWMVFRWHTNGHGTIHVESFVITAAAAFRNDPVWNGPDAFCAEFSTDSPQKKQHQAAAHRKLTSITQTCSIIKEKKSSTSWKIRFFAFSLSVRLENQFPSQSAIDQWEQWTFSLCATKVSILFCSWPLNQPESWTVSSYMMKKQEATSVKLQIINRVII